jgi:hypothetical protein
MQENDMKEQLRQMELGQQGETLEMRIEWEGALQLRPVVYTRKVHLSIQAEIAGPEEFLETAWGDITASARLAGAITGLPSIAGSRPGILEAFEEAFFACLASRWPLEARRIRVALSTQFKPEKDWQRSLHRAG